MDKNQQQPPTTVKEVGIHIGYMRSDIHDLKVLVQKLPESFATKAQLEGLEKATNEEQEKLWQAIKDVKTAAKWWVTTTIAAAAVVVTLITAKG